TPCAHRGAPVAGESGATRAGARCAVPGLLAALSSLDTGTQGALRCALCAGRLVCWIFPTDRHDEQVDASLRMARAATLRLVQVHAEVDIAAAYPEPQLSRGGWRHLSHRLWAGRSAAAAWRLARQGGDHRAWRQS